MREPTRMQRAFVAVAAIAIALVASHMIPISAKPAEGQVVMAAYVAPARVAILPSPRVEPVTPVRSGPSLARSLWRAASAAFAGHTSDDLVQLQQSQDNAVDVVASIE